MIDDNNKHDDELEEVEDFDESELEDDQNYEDFDENGLTLGDTLRDKPIVKFGIIAGVIVLIVGIFLFFRSGEPLNPSAVPGPSDLTSPPGTEEVSPKIREAIIEKDAERREIAIEQGGSSLDTPLEPPVGRIQLPPDQEEEEDPLQRWKRLQQERLEKEAEQARLLQPEGPQADFISQDAIQAMADAMAAQMQIILEGLGDIPLQYVAMTSPEYLEALRAEQEEKAEAVRIAAEQAANKDIAEILLPAGEIVYAQTILEANSDVPGPVLARIMSGPLRGAKVLGSFEVQNEYLTLQFNTIVLDGISQGIDAIALDPGTTLPGVVSEVDHRYFTRVVLPAAAAFVEGAAEAIADSGRTTITISDSGTSATTSSSNTGRDEEIASGIEEAAQELSDILDERANETKVLVRLESGTPIGLLFLEPVLKEEN